MNVTTVKGTVNPLQPWVDVQSSALAWHDKGRKEWVGCNVKLGEDYFVVDRVEDRGGEVWRLHLIAPAEEG